MCSAYAFNPVATFHVHYENIDYTKLLVEHVQLSFLLSILISSRDVSEENSQPN